MNPPLNSLIFSIRDQKVILDADLAKLYGVPTKRLNEQVKRNSDRFPADFMYQLTAKEWQDLLIKIAASNLEMVDGKRDTDNRSQIATGSQKHRTSSHRPYAFTEHGALMAANVLNSPQAVKMAVYVVRAFINQRELLMAQADVLKKLAQIDAKLLKHDDALRAIWRELQPLLTPPPEPLKRPIGFRAEEKSTKYRSKSRASKKNS